MRAALLSLLMLLSASEPVPPELSEHLTFLKEYMETPAALRARQDVEAGRAHLLRYGAIWLSRGGRFGVCAPNLDYELIDNPWYDVIFSDEQEELSARMKHYVDDYNDAVMDIFIQDGRSLCTPEEKWDEFLEWLQPREKDLKIGVMSDRGGRVRLTVRPLPEPTRISNLKQVCSQMAAHGIKRSISFFGLHGSNPSSEDDMSVPKARFTGNCTAGEIHIEP